MPGQDDTRKRLDEKYKRKAAEYKHEWYLLHREQEIAKATKRQKENREKYNAYQREYNCRRKEARLEGLD